MNYILEGFVKINKKQFERDKPTAQLWLIIAKALNEGRSSLEAK